MDKWSKKYNKWFRCDEPINEYDKLFKFGEYYYRPDKDILIHKSFLGEYIEKCKKGHKNFKKMAFMLKNNIEVKQKVKSIIGPNEDFLNNHS